MISNLIRVQTAGGNTAVFDARPDTSDGALVYGIIEGKEYDLPRNLSGWAIDIGAHIGIVSVALALDNPELHIVAVEALPENVIALRRNLSLNGVEDRVIVECAAAASEDETTVPITYGWSQAPNQPDHYMADNRFIGGMVGPNESSTTIECRALSLATILNTIDEAEYGPWTDKGGPAETHRKHKPISIALLKIDCEGCEWFFLDAVEMHRVQRVIGEMHIGRHGGAADLRRLLADFDVMMDDSLVVATFEAVRR